MQIPVTHLFKQVLRRTQNSHRFKASSGSITFKPRILHFTRNIHENEYFIARRDCEIVIITIATLHRIAQQCSRASS